MAEFKVVDSPDWTIEARRAFMKLPIEERHRQMAEQAEQILDYYGNGQSSVTIYRLLGESGIQPAKRGYFWKIGPSALRRAARRSVNCLSFAVTAYLMTSSSGSSSFFHFAMISRPSAV
jgi:hypothetical protein